MVLELPFRAFLSGGICARLQGGRRERMRERVGGGVLSPSHPPQCGPVRSFVRPPAARPPISQNRNTVLVIWPVQERWRLNHQHADSTRFRLKWQKYRSCCGFQMHMLTLWLWWRTLLAVARPSINRVSERRFVPFSKSKRVKVRRRPPHCPNLSLDGRTFIAMRKIIIIIKKERREEEGGGGAPAFLHSLHSYRAGVSYKRRAC